MKNYNLEQKLFKEAPLLHEKFKNNIVVFNKMLNSYLSWFPTYTDHSILHSIDVLYFSNKLVENQIDRLNALECYILIMSCYLHDIGMGINEKDYDALTGQLDLNDYISKNASADSEAIIRDFHNELSGLMIRKYADLFDIQSENTLFAIIQVSRGHRKTDLFDEKEYPDIVIESGIIHTSYLAAIIRLADELNVAKDRNPELLFDTNNLTRQVDIDAFGTHESIKTVEMRKDKVILHVKPKEERFIQLVEELRSKLQKTMDYCNDVVDKRSDFSISQKEVRIKYED